MRGLRSFLLLLAILAGLGAYLYFVEWKRTPDAADERQHAFSVEAADIEEISVRSETGEQTVLRRDGENWRITEPVQTAADQTEVSGLTSALASLRVERALDGEIGDLAEYGLAAPRIEVRFRAGGQERRLALGARTPPGSDIYARVDEEPRVILVAAHLDATFNRSTFDLRDKALIRAPRETLDTVSISTPRTSLELARADGDWRITQPFTAPADYGEVNSLISRLMSAQMRTIEDTPTPPVAAQGLDRPAATVRAGQPAVVLHLGAKAGPDTVYGRIEGRAELFTVDASLLEALQRPPGEYRQRDLFDARAFNTSRVEISHAGSTSAFEKRRGPDEKEEARWRRVEPAEGDADGAKVDSLIFAATAARAEGFVETASVRPPAVPDLLIVLRFDEGKREDRVSFWRRGEDVFATRADAPGVARVTSSIFEDIVRAVEDLK